MALLLDRVASMVSGIGRESFGKAVLGLFDPAWEISHCAAFERGDRLRPPRILAASALSDADEALSQEVTRQWLKEDFACDPWLDALDRQTGEVPAVRFEDWRAVPRQAVARARIAERYYAPLGVGEEATCAVRVGRKVICVSLFKSCGGRPFSPAQKAALGRFAGLILGCAERHAQLWPAAPAWLSSAAGADAQDPAWTQVRADKFARLRAALLADRHQLTAREADVCAYIVMGHTTFAIGMLLSISPNTVATHRRTAYAKLKLSSQTELFHVCLKHCL